MSIEWQRRRQTSPQGQAQAGVAKRYHHSCWYGIHWNSVLMPSLSEEVQMMIPQQTYLFKIHTGHHRLKLASLCIWVWQRGSVKMMDVRQHCIWRPGIEQKYCLNWMEVFHISSVLNMFLRGLCVYTSIVHAGISLHNFPEGMAVFLGSVKVWQWPQLAYSLMAYFLW